MNKVQRNHRSDQKNSNTGTSGHNDAYQKALDNRANQLNPNNPLYKSHKKEA